MSIGFFFDAFGAVAKIIEQWRPNGCNTEKDFENSLLNELQNKLKGKKVTAQYGSGKQRFAVRRSRKPAC